MRRFTGRFCAPTDTAATPLETPNHDPIGELVPGLTEQDQLNSRSFLDTVVSEAITAGKAFVNGVASAGYSAVTLGLGHLTNMPYAVTQEDIANGYNTMESVVQFGATIAIYAGSGGVAGLLEEGGALASAASGGLELFMTATNVSFAGQGVYSIATNGLTWQNALQVGLSGFAAASSISEAFQGLNSAGDVAGDLGEGLFSGGYTGRALTQGEVDALTEEFQAAGGIVDQSASAQRYLQLRGAGGLTLNESTILLPAGPTRTAVFEELIHAEQFAGGAVFGPGSVVQLEIDAAEILIRNRNAFQLPNEEVLQVIENLRNLRTQLRP